MRHLFQRTTRQLELTEAGEIYLRRIAPLINEFEYALDEAQKVSKLPAGKLRITASVAFGQMCLLPHITEFKKIYPDIKLELLLTDSVVDLVAEGIDLACRLAPESNSELIGTRLFDTHYYVCASPEYVESMPAIVHPDDLTNHKCIVFTLAEYRSQWILKDAKSNRCTVQINSDLSVSSAQP